MRHFVSAACGLWLAAAAPALAGDIVVVELYTSQGCSSCPPADEFVAMLAANPRILPLALHVDYWDYIGWADHFAHPKFSERQRDYARARHAYLVNLLRLKQAAGIVEASDLADVNRWLVADAEASLQDPNSAER